MASPRFEIEIYRKPKLFGRPEWRWRMRARNGEIVANSTEGYINLADMEDEIDDIRTGIADAPIVEVER